MQYLYCSFESRGFANFIGRYTAIPHFYMVHSYMDFLALEVFPNKALLDTQEVLMLSHFVTD